MSLQIFGIPHLRHLRKNIKNNICVVPIMFYGKGTSFSLAENYKDDICVVSWYVCREVFHDDFPTSNHLFINHKVGEHNNLHRFIVDLENKLGLDKSSEIFKTNRKTVTLMFLSDFWKSRIMFSLLTLFIRFSIENKQSSFSLSSLRKCKYLCETIPAIMLLLDGKSHYKGKKGSWYDQFCGLNSQDCAKYLC